MPLAVTAGTKETTMTYEGWLHRVADLMGTVELDGALVPATPENLTVCLSDEPSTVFGTGDTPEQYARACKDEYGKVSNESL